MSQIQECVKCGLTSDFPEAFIHGRRSFGFSRQAWCPICWGRKQARAAVGACAVYLGLAVMGYLLQVFVPHLWFGPFLMLLCLFQVFLILTIVPHELGHAWVARLLGWRVFRVVIGIGKTLWKGRFAGFEFEWKPAPVGGVTLIGARQTRWFRSKLFLIILAGLLVNVMLGAVALFFYPWELGGAFDLDQLPAVPKMFLFANLFVVALNLWPRTMTTLSMKLPSDGKQLLQAFFLKRKTVAERHADYFTMEAAECTTRGDYAAASQWLEAGLTLYPENFGLLATKAATDIQQNQFHKARETCLELLHRDSIKGLQRYLILNNLAYVDALIGTPDLLEEAERYSLEAFAGIPWFPFMKGTRGTVLVQRGELDKGLELLEQSFRETDDVNGKAENACFLAIGESGRGNPGRAKQFLDLARQLNPHCYLLPRADEALNAQVKT